MARVYIDTKSYGLRNYVYFRIHIHEISMNQLYGKGADYIHTKKQSESANPRCAQFEEPETV